jgi:D-beta-D-heptose 7-phosphate kinase/D-beta-D-heptose 1-phosphate adenosyltransferase
MLNTLANVTVLVVGDVMLDRYWWGSVKRISPEAPVPVVDLQKSSFAPGGAANVAVNIAGLGAKPLLVGITGTDADAGTLCDLLDGSGVAPRSIHRSATRPTTVKTRIVAHNQQVVRVDQETTASLSADEEAAVWGLIEADLPAADVVLISDYAKGLLSETFTKRLIASAAAAGKRVIVDPKGKDYSRYTGAALLTPNRREAAEACNLPDHHPDLVHTAGERLMNELQLEMALITEGEEGMTLFRKGSEPLHLAAAAHEVYDVTGAGDTVIACLAVGLGAGMDLVAAAELANIAAGLVVEQVGTTAITRELLEPALAKRPLARNSA